MAWAMLALSLAALAAAGSLQSDDYQAYMEQYVGSSLRQEPSSRKYTDQYAGDYSKYTQLSAGAQQGGAQQGGGGYQKYMDQYAGGYQTYMDQYAGRYVRSAGDRKHLQSEFAHAPESATDCHTMEELDAWWESTQAHFNTYIPQAFRGHAEATLRATYDSNAARIREEEAAATPQAPAAPQAPADAQRAAHQVKQAAPKQLRGAAPAEAPALTAPALTPAPSDGGFLRGVLPIAEASKPEPHRAGSSLPAIVGAAALAAAAGLAAVAMRSSRRRADCVPGYLADSLLEPIVPLAAGAEPSDIRAVA